MRWFNLTSLSNEQIKKGGIGASLDDVWSPMMSSSDSMTLTSLLENFHRERLASGGGKKVQAKNDWNRMLQNILSFRLADGSFHDGDRVSDLRSVKSHLT